MGAENLCDQAIFVNQATGAVAPLDAVLVEIDDGFGQRAQRRGRVQGAVRPVRCCCDTRSHVVSELVEEVWLMPET